jgi:hypothetical protein
VGVCRSGEEPDLPGLPCPPGEGLALRDHRNRPPDPSGPREEVTPSRGAAKRLAAVNCELISEGERLIGRHEVVATDAVARVALLIDGTEEVYQPSGMLQNPDRPRTRTIKSQVVRLTAAVVVEGEGTVGPKSNSNTNRDGTVGKNVSDSGRPGMFRRQGMAE